MKMKMKNRSHRYDINRARPRHGHKYSKYKVPQQDDAYSNNQATFEVQFRKKLSNTETGLKKSVAYKKKACII